MQLRCLPLLFAGLAALALRGQEPVASGKATTPPAVPDWALPGSSTHKQVAPPPDFHRPSVNFAVPIGIFEGQSDIGGAVVPGSASFDAAAGRYTVRSAGYNVWYTRDEFRYLWKKMAGDVSLAADIAFPNPEGFGDRKAVLVIRQNLDDDATEALVALLEKHGDEFMLFVSLEGEPMHAFGPPITLHLEAPFCVGLGFCSHQPATIDAAVFSRVVLENAAGRIR
ncbi:MAG TPA: hypothetical protein VGM73_05650 [Candidatus Didemnitutus sp.]|jgi:hypothetical protein